MWSLDYSLAILPCFNSPPLYVEMDSSVVGLRARLSTLPPQICVPGCSMMAPPFDLSPVFLQVWFKNRRAKDRRKHRQEHQERLPGPKTDASPSRSQGHIPVAGSSSGASTCVGKSGVNCIPQLNANPAVFIHNVDKVCEAGMGVVQEDPMPGQATASADPGQPTAAEAAAFPTAEPQASAESDVLAASGVSSICHPSVYTVVSFHNVEEIWESLTCVVQEDSMSGQTTASAGQGQPTAVEVAADPIAEPPA